MKTIFSKVIFTAIILFFAVSSALQSQTASLQWLKSQGGSDEDFTNCIIETSDNNYVIAGTSSSVDGDLVGITAYGGRDAWLLKVDKNNGNILWQNRFGGAGLDQITCVVQTTDGGYIAIGTTASTSLPNFHGSGSYDYYVVKTDNAGNLEWQKCYGGSLEDWGGVIIQASDGNYVIAGRSKSSDGDIAFGHQGSVTTFDIWVAKIESGGSHNVIWQRSCGGTGNDTFCSSLNETSGGGYIFSGLSESNDGDVTGMQHGSGDNFICKLTSAGSLSWAKLFGSTGSEGARTVFETADGNYIFTGTIASADGDVTLLPLPNPSYHGLSDYWVVKINSGGTHNILWQKCLGGSQNDFPLSLTAFIPNGNSYVVCGRSNSTNGNVNDNHAGSYDCWMVKVDSLNVYWTKSVGGTLYDGANWITRTFDGGFAFSAEGFSDDGDIIGFHPPTTQEDSYIFKLDEVAGNTITTGSVPVSLCINSSFGVPYISNGLFFPGNIFTVQLSDRNGDFSNPVLIGQLMSTTSGTITVTIPANTLSGAGYKVRVIGSSPTTIGSDNGLAILINPLPLPQINGKNSVCNKSSNVYTAVSAPGHSYSWKATGGFPNGASNAQSVEIFWLTSAPTGTVTLTETNDISGCKDSTDLVVNISPNPTPAINGPTVVCRNNIQTYTTPFLTGHSYQWRAANGQFIGWSNIPSVQINWNNTFPSATLTLVETNDTTGCKDSLVKIITVNPLPSPVISGPYATCQNRTESFSTTFSLGHTYKWKADSASIIGASNMSTVDVQFYSSYPSATVTVIDSINATGCKDSTFKIISILPKPTPVIFGANQVCRNTVVSYTTTAV
ncbi:MAG: hypothetical protein WCT77_09355, partial [Bacteroidota bacterium]